jgi:hypothetical protein
MTHSFAQDHVDFSASAACCTARGVDFGVVAVTAATIAAVGRSWLFASIVDDHLWQSHIYDFQVVSGRHSTTSHA